MYDVDTQDAYSTALYIADNDMLQETCELGPHVSWSKTKVRSLDSLHGSGTTDVNVNCYTVCAVHNLGSMYLVF